MGHLEKDSQRRNSLSGDLEDELILIDHCNTNLQYSVLFTSGVPLRLLGYNVISEVRSSSRSISIV